MRALAKSLLGSMMRKISLALVWGALGAGALYLYITDKLWFGTTERPQERLDVAQIVVLRTPGGMLEVATLNRVEEFTWEATHTCPLVNCGALLRPAISRVRVPVNYVYRVPLAPTWELRLKGEHYELIVPSMQPSLPVAFDTTKLELETERGWFSPAQRRNEKALMRHLGPELERRSGQESHLSSVNAPAAKTVQEFARTWMREQGVGGDTPVKVTFRHAP